MNIEFVLMNLFSDGYPYKIKVKSHCDTPSSMLLRKRNELY